MELKINAYVDYVNSVARVGFVSPSERAKVLDQVAASKARICVFGDQEVVEAAAKFEQSSRNLANIDAQWAFTNLCQVMRERGIAGGSVDDEDITTILFGHEPTAPQVAKPASPDGH